MYDPDEECKELIATIKRLYKQKNLTPHALAKKAGISTSTISYLVNGKTKPQLYTVLLLCNVLGVSMGELFDQPKNGISGEGSDKAQYEVNREIEELLSLNNEEKRLLVCWRESSEKKKALIRIFVNFLICYDDKLLPGEESAKNDE